MKPLWETTNSMPQLTEKMMQDPGCKIERIFEEKTYFDLRIFNPNSNLLNLEMSTCYRYHGEKKHHVHELHAREVEKGCFT